MSKLLTSDREYALEIRKAHLRRLRQAVSAIDNLLEDDDFRTDSSWRLQRQMEIVAELLANLKDWYEDEMIDQAVAKTEDITNYVIPF